MHGSMDKDYSNNSHWYDPNFNHPNDRPRQHERTYIRYDVTQRKYVYYEGKPPSKRAAGKHMRRRAHRLAQRTTGWHCFWCDIPLSYNIEGGDTPENRLRTDVRYPTVDHVIELANGGPDTDENCVLACQPCNSARNKTFKDRSPE